MDSTVVAVLKEFGSRTPASASNVVGRQALKVLEMIADGALHSSSFSQPLAHHHPYSMDPIMLAILHRAFASARIQDWVNCFELRARAKCISAGQQRSSLFSNQLVFQHERETACHCLPMVLRSQQGLHCPWYW
jgi:hypothetical protein